MTIRFCLIKQCVSVSLLLNLYADWTIEARIPKSCLFLVPSIGLLNFIVQNEICTDSSGSLPFHYLYYFIFALRFEIDDLCNVWWCSSAVKKIYALQFTELSIPNWIFFFFCRIFLVHDIGLCRHAITSIFFVSHAFVLFISFGLLCDLGTSKLWMCDILW